jgi:phage-related protein
MAAQAKVIIKGQNDIGVAVKSAAADLGSLKGAADKLGGALKTALSVTAIIASVKMLGSAVSATFSEFSAAERAYKQLALALGDSTSYEKVTSVVERLSSQTLAGKGDIEAMVAQLAALGKSADEIESISEAAVYLSNVTGKDLNGSMMNLLDSYTGATGELRKLGIELDGLTKDELAHGAAVEAVIDKLGEYSAMMADGDTAQHLTNMKNTWGDIRQQVGGIIDYNFGPWLGGLDAAFSGIKTNLTNIINYVGAVMKNLPQAFRLTLSTVWEMLRRTFEWDSLKLIITTTAQNIGIVISAMLKAVFESIPKLLGNAVVGIISWVTYIALNIESAILGAFQNAINKAGERIQGTWVGKLFSLGDKLANLDMGAGESKDEAAFYKQQADRNFENLGPLLRDALTDAIDTAQTVVLNSADMVSSLYGDIGLDFKTALDEIVAPDLEAIAQKADAANQTKLLSQIASSGEGTAASSAQTALNTRETDTRMGDQVAAQLGEGLNGLLGNLLGDAGGGLAGMAAEEMLGGVGAIVGALAPLADIIFNTLSPLGILLTIIEGFVSVMEPALTAVFQPLVDVFTWIGATLASLFLPVLDVLATAFALVGNILMAVLTPVLQGLEPVFQVLGGVLTALSPILLLVAKAFTILMSPLQYVADLLSWLGSWVQYLGSVIATAAYNLVHPFRKKSYASSPGSFSSDAFSGLADRLSNIDAIADQGSVATDAASTTTAVGSAAYQGGTQVTINIYQQAPVVGSGGMRAFAQMIRGEFEQLDYYGVTT